MSVFSYVSSSSNIGSIMVSMKAKGWFVRPSSNPPSIHVVVTPMHARVADEYLEDLRVATLGAAQRQSAHFV
jgi:sphinganine-1-phosphate aldolase